MSPGDIVSMAYSFFSRKRLLLFAATGAVILLSLLGLQRIELNENVLSMLPDGTDEAGADFALLQKSPFSRKLVVLLRGGPDLSPDELIAATDRLAAQLKPPVFPRVITGPSTGGGQSMLNWLRVNQASLTSPEDVDAIRRHLTEEAMRARLEQIRSRLTGPEGIGWKYIFQSDPLGWLPLYLEKLRFLNPMPGIRMESGRFISADDRQSLILVDTAVDFTDALGSRQMLAEFQAAVQAAVPTIINVALISGHRYTLANSERVKEDLAVVLSVAAFGILAIFMVFKRTWSELWAFVLPVAVLVLASSGAALIYRPVSAITLGFGAVLLGLTDDYPIHIHAALSRRDRPPSETLAEVFPPLAFTGLTTLVAFGVMLFSSLPVQRQLAVFSLIGIIAALLLALIVLPHLIGTPARTSPPAAVFDRPGLRPRSPHGVIVCWGVMIGLSLVAGTRLEFNGDLKAMNYMTEELRRAEAELRETWGDFRSRAMVVVEASDIESALRRNEEVFRYLQPRLGPERMLSLAPVLPSEQTQESNRSRWRRFWTPERIEQTRDLLEAEGRRLGFKPEAFNAFWQQLEGPAGRVTADSLRAAGLADLVESLVLSADNGVRLITLVPDTSEIAALFAQGAGSPSGARLVSQQRFGRIVTAAVAHDFLFFFSISLAAVCLLLIVLFRHPIKILLALIPVGTGLIGAAGFMGAFGYAINLFNVVASILIIGLGVEYGIFMVSRHGRGMDRITERAVLLSSLTTLVGFGSLSFARHPALNSIGLAVLLGIGGAAISALIVVPAVCQTAWVGRALSKGHRT